ncbi:hypothetical protein [Nocardia alni]|uniref:hypothetical protein n=1 Tax=Nocardia alni TaxID=2815723 RepID=UPI001C220132|nr:hypothetical protein [Nocardia alni]
MDALATRTVPQWRDIATARAVIRPAAGLPQRRGELAPVAAGRGIMFLPLW